MARAKPDIEAEKPLYERDFCLWVEEQVRLLKDGRLQQLDVVNLIDEVEDLGIHAEESRQSNLVVVLKHLLKHQYPAPPSLAQLAGIDRRAPAAAAQRSGDQPEPARLRPRTVRAVLPGRPPSGADRDRPDGRSHPSRAGLHPRADARSRLPARLTTASGPGVPPGCPRVAEERAAIVLGAPGAPAHTAVAIQIRAIGGDQCPRFAPRSSPPR